MQNLKTLHAVILNGELYFGFISSFFFFFHFVSTFVILVKYKRMRGYIISSTLNDVVWAGTNVSHSSCGGSIKSQEAPTGPGKRSISIDRILLIAWRYACKLLEKSYLTVTIMLLITLLVNKNKYSYNNDLYYNYLYSTIAPFRN